MPEAHFVAEIAEKQQGFLSIEDAAKIAKYDRLRPILIRTNAGRLICGAQYVTHFVELIDRSGTDWVRDLSLPATDPVYQTAGSLAR